MAKLPYWGRLGYDLLGPNGLPIAPEPEGGE